MLEDVRRQSTIYGAKISGSGLGDCIIALGELPEKYECIVDAKILKRIPVSMSMRGVECEKI